MPVASSENPPVITPAAIFPPESRLFFTAASSVLWLWHLGQGGPKVAVFTLIVTGAAGCGWENCCDCATGGAWLSLVSFCGAPQLLQNAASPTLVPHDLQNAILPPLKLADTSKSVVTLQSDEIKASYICMKTTNTAK